MELHFYQPKDDTLKKYIEGYYFFSDNGQLSNRQYLTFPNNYCIVTVNLGSIVRLGDNEISIEPSLKKNIYATVAYHYLKPIEVNYAGAFREITIYFKPLGINCFVDNLKTMFSEKRMTEFKPQFPDFQDQMNRIFQFDKRSLQIDALEDYWLTKLREKDLSWIRIILSDIESNIKIGDIAKKHHISRKHLNNLMHKNLGKSPIEYRKIFRFRKAVSSKKGLQSLTELSYENLFFDQSHLIKDFKSLTKINPRDFFKNVNTENKNIWLFEPR